MDEYIKSLSYLFGEQTFYGDSMSEGGFERGKVSGGFCTPISLYLAAQAVL